MYDVPSLMLPSLALLSPKIFTPFGPIDRNLQPDSEQRRHQGNPPQGGQDPILDIRRGAAVGSRGVDIGEIWYSATSATEIQRAEDGPEEG